MIRQISLQSLGGFKSIIQMTNEKFYQQKGEIYSTNLTQNAENPWRTKELATGW